MKNQYPASPKVPQKSESAYPQISAETSKEVPPPVLVPVIGRFCIYLDDSRRWLKQANERALDLLVLGALNYLQRLDTADISTRIDQLQKLASLSIPRGIEVAFQHLIRTFLKSRPDARVSKALKIYLNLFPNETDVVAAIGKMEFDTPIAADYPFWHVLLVERKEQPIVPIAILSQRLAEFLEIALFWADYSAAHSELSKEIPPAMKYHLCLILAQSYLFGQQKLAAKDKNKLARAARLFEIQIILKDQAVCAFAGEQTHPDLRRIPYDRESFDKKWGVQSWPSTASDASP